MVDLLQRHHDGGRRFEPTEFVEEGSRVAVGLNVRDRRWGGESVEVFKVFTFAASGSSVVLLQDCAGRDEALRYLSGEEPR